MKLKKIDNFSEDYLDWSSKTNLYYLGCYHQLLIVSLPVLLAMTFFVSQTRAQLKQLRKESLSINEYLLKLKRLVDSFISLDEPEI